MFKSQKGYRTFLTLLLTYALDLVGFSIAFPVLAPLLLHPDSHFFAAGTPELFKTTMLGLLFAIFGIAQFFGAPTTGVLADHYGRYKTFLLSIGLSIFGYLALAFGVYDQSLAWLFAGRIVTGFCSGNFALAQSATADLTAPEQRSKAFGVLLGVGGLGFVVGPWFGGKLANPAWLHGSGAFLFAAIAALINLLVIVFFFEETRDAKHHTTRGRLIDAFKDIQIVVRNHQLRRLLCAYLLFSIGWGFFAIFSPTFLVQKFALSPSRIGDMFAYMALCWFFVSTFLNKELIGKFSLQSLTTAGIILGTIGVASFIAPPVLWPYWIIIPVALCGGALFWVNVSSLLSLTASEQMQGRVLGASSSMWSIGQIVSSLAAGPLAGMDLYFPISCGALFLLATLLYWMLRCSKHKSH